MNMKYKVYVVKIDDVTKQLTFIEADFNWCCGFDTIEQSYDMINRMGDDYVHYVILPYIYMTS